MLEDGSLGILKWSKYSQRWLIDIVRNDN